MFFGVATPCGCAFFIPKIMIQKEITALFIGNRDCYFIKEEYIKQAIIVAIHMGIRIFLNGGMGHFDETCAKVLHKLKERYPNIKSILVTAYHVPRTPYIDLFDEIIYPFEEQQETYFFHKRAIPERNKIMVEWSSVAVSYVYRAGGAANTLSYAKEKGLKIISLL